MHAYTTILGLLKSSE